jgi:hypothetical protein
MRYLFLYCTLFTHHLTAQVQINDPLSEPRQVPKAWELGRIEWDTVFADGSKLAILEGQRDVPGQAFTYAFYLPDGQWVAPHWHCADARVFVASGTILLGYGEQMNRQKTLAYGPGSYLLVPYKTSHFEGAQGNTTIIGTGVGPWCTYDHPQ